jgi:hypothetical protein
MKYVIFAAVMAIIFLITGLITRRTGYGAGKGTLNLSCKPDGDQKDDLRKKHSDEK